MKTDERTAPLEAVGPVDLCEIIAVGLPCGEGMGRLREATGQRIQFSTDVCHKTGSMYAASEPLEDFIMQMMDHKEGRKEGSCWSHLTFHDNRRDAAHAVSTQLVVFDLDHGAPIEGVIETLREEGTAAIITTTHSHLSTRTEKSFSRFEKWQADNPDGGAGDFMTSYGYHPSVTAGAEFLTENGRIKTVKRGHKTMIVVKHAPCPKYRLIAFADRPWHITDYEEPNTAKRAYQLGLRTIADNLDIQFDESAKDLARLFFDPRHAAGRDYDAWFLPGGPLTDVWPDGGEMMMRDAVDLKRKTKPVRRDTISGELLPAQQLDIPRITSALMSIKNDDRFTDRSEWIRVGAALHDATQGGPQGLELFQAWSRTWTGGDHDPVETARVWKSLASAEKRGGVTAGTLFWMAQADGWQDADRALDRLTAHGDLWNGRQFAGEHRGKLMFVASTSQWLQWTGVRWAALSPGEVEQFAKRTADRLLLEVLGGATQGGDDVGDRLKAAQAVHRSLPKIRKMVEAAQTEEGLWVPSPDFFDRDPMLLGVANGVLDLRVGELLLPEPDMMISKVAGTEYVPEVQAPRFEAFIAKILPDPEVRAFVQRAVGLSLTGEVGPEAFYFCFGNGANGKSVFTTILSALFGEYAVELDTVAVTKTRHESEAQREFAKLPGKRIAFVNEIAQGDVWHDGNMKKLASRDQIVARLLYHEGFAFAPSHCLWVKANHRAGAHDAGDGFWRRANEIPFTVQIPEEERIHDLDRQIIAQELPGVLNWALAGCADYRKNGLQTPEAVRRLTEAYRADTDLLGQFLEMRCVFEPGTRTRSGDLYSAYREFCEEMGVKPGSQIAFGRALVARGIEKAPGTSVRAYVGLRLKRRDEMCFDELTGVEDMDAMIATVV